MNLDKFLNLMAATFGSIGAIYVMLGILAMSPDLMARLASTPFDFSLDQVEALACQKGDSVAGFVFVFVAFALTAVTLIFVPDGVPAFERKGVALGLAVVLAGGSYVTLRFISDGISHREKLAIGMILASQYLDGISKRGRVETWDAPSLQVYARLLDLEVPAGEPVRSLLACLAAKTGNPLPPSLDYSAVEPQK